MKLLNKQIDMISWTSKEGVVTPVRFRIEEDGIHCHSHRTNFANRKKYVWRHSHPFFPLRQPYLRTRAHLRSHL